MRAPRSIASIADKYIARDGTLTAEPEKQEIVEKASALADLENDPETIRLVREAIHVMRGGRPHSPPERVRARDSALATLDRALAALLERISP